jgi:hypothetical protein
MSFDQHDERLSCFDDIGGELRGVTAADVLRRVEAAIIWASRDPSNMCK